MKYNTINKIATELNISNQQVYKIYNKGINKLFNKIKKDNGFNEYETFLMLYTSFSNMGMELDIVTFYKMMNSKIKDKIKTYLKKEYSYV